MRTQTGIETITEIDEADKTQLSSIDSVQKPPKKRITTNC